LVMESLKYESAVESSPGICTPEEKNNTIESRIPMRDFVAVCLVLGSIIHCGPDIIWQLLIFTVIFVRLNSLTRPIIFLNSASFFPHWRQVKGEVVLAINLQ